MQNWSLSFGIALDVVWISRNDFVFNGNCDSSQQLPRRVLGRIDSVLDTTKRERLVGGTAEPSLTPKPMVWQKPPHNFYTLNSDATISNSGALVGCGGLLKDELGSLVWAYTHKLDPCTILEAELWSIYRGVAIAQGKGIQNLVVETDNAMAIQLLVDGVSPSHALAAIVVSIKAMLPTPTQVQWHHVFREANRATDALVRFCVGQFRVFSVFDSAPACTTSILEEDTSQYVDL